MCEIDLYLTYFSESNCLEISKFEQYFHATSHTPRYQSMCTKSLIGSPIYLCHSQRVRQPVGWHVDPTDMHTRSIDKFIALAGHVSSKVSAAADFQSVFLSERSEPGGGSLFGCSSNSIRQVRKLWLPIGLVVSSGFKWYR